jgi:hypothetical protein
MECCGKKGLPVLDSGRVGRVKSGFNLRRQVLWETGGEREAGRDAGGGSRAAREREWAGDGRMINVVRRTS